MKTSYTTTILGFGNHAAIEIPDKNLIELGGSRRAPLKVTLNEALKANGLEAVSRNLTYSKCKEFARQVSEAKGEDTRMKRVEKVTTGLRSA